MKKQRTNSWKQILTVLGATAMLLGFSTAAEAGRSRVKFTNSGSSSVQIKVVWEAAGCAGIKWGRSTVCGSKTVTISGKGSASVSYKYKWGTTGRKVVYLCKSGNKYLTKQAAKNGKSHNITVSKGSIKTSNTLKYSSCIK